MSSPPGDVTRLLLAWSTGDRDALEGLIPVVYGELRRIADRYFCHERPDHTLQATALVHEAYFKLIDQDHARWQNRAQFFGVAAQLMRRILVDHARTHGAAKRGGGVSPVTLVDAADASPPRGVDVIALDDALARLTTLYPEQGRQHFNRHIASELRIARAIDLPHAAGAEFPQHFVRAHSNARRETSRRCHGQHLQGTRCGFVCA